MKLTCAKYGLEINFIENEINLLIVENPVCMSEIVANFKQQCEGMEGIFLLSEKNNIMQFEKLAKLIINPFSLDFNDRKVLSKLYTQMETYAVDFFEEKESINSKMISLLDDIVLRSPYQNLTYNLELNWNDFFKLYGICFENISGSLLERITEYIKLLSNLLDIKLICLVNIKSYLTVDEIKELYKTAFYYKVYLLLLESVEQEKMEEEKELIIDKDLCIIIK